jgi:hypothetical protein
LGEDSDKKVNECVNKIKNEELEILCIVGLFNEGTSIDNLKTVIFGDMRYSHINLIQICYRISRLHHNKPYGNIVLPLQENDLSKEDDDLKNIIKILANNDYKLKDSIKKDENNRVNRIKIGIDGKYKKEESEDDDDENDKENDEERYAELLCEKIYDSFGEMISGLSIEDKIKEFIAEVEKNGIPSSKNKELKFSDNTLMGRFWEHCKGKDKCNRDEYSSLLENETLKQDWIRYQKEKDKNKDKIKLLIKDKIKEFIKHVEKNGIPKQKDKEIKFSDNTLMGIFWENCKKQDKCNKDEYSSLLENETLKDDWERYQKEKDKNKNKTKLLIKDKIKEFLKYIEKNGIPKQNDKIKFSDNTLMGRFWPECKKQDRCDKEYSKYDVYKKLLENDMLNQDWIRYQKSK